MKIIHIIAVLALLIFAVDSASAFSAEYPLTHPENAYAGVNFNVKVTVVDDTITVTDQSTWPSGETNIDIKEIGIVLPDTYQVKVIQDGGKHQVIYDVSDPQNNQYDIGYGNFEESMFGRFNTQINRKPGSNDKTTGPIVIKLNKALTTLSPNNVGNTFVVHISFGDDSQNEVSGSTWVSTRIPEFTTMAVPVAAILGLLLITQRKRKGE